MRVWRGVERVGAHCEVIYQGDRYRVNDVGDVFVLTTYTAPSLSRFAQYGRQYERGSTTQRDWILVADSVLAREVRAVFRSTYDKVS